MLLCKASSKLLLLATIDIVKVESISKFEKAKFLVGRSTNGSENTEQIYIDIYLLYLI